MDKDEQYPTLEDAFGLVRERVDRLARGAELTAEVDLLRCDDGVLHFHLRVGDEYHHFDRWCGCCHRPDWEVDEEAEVTGGVEYGASHHGPETLGEETNQA